MPWKSEARDGLPLRTASRSLAFWNCGGSLVGSGAEALALRKKKFKAEVKSWPTICMLHAHCPTANVRKREAALLAQFNSAPYDGRDRRLQFCSRLRQTKPRTGFRVVGCGARVLSFPHIPTEGRASPRSTSSLHYLTGSAEGGLKSLFGWYDRAPASAWRDSLLHGASGCKMIVSSSSISKTQHSQDGRLMEFKWRFLLDWREGCTFHEEVAISAS